MKSLRPSVAVLASLVVGCLFAALAQTAPMQWLERHLLDRRFCWREQLGYTVPVSPQLAMVLLDQKTLDDPTLRTVPLALWLPQYCELMGGLLRSGASVVGFDAVLSKYKDPYYAVDNPHLDNPLQPLNDALGQPGAGRVVVGAEGHFVPGAAQVDRLVLPTGDISLVVGYDHVGLLNLTADVDDVERFQWLAPVPVRPDTPVFSDDVQSTWQADAMMGFGPLIATLSTHALPPRFDSYAYINYAGQNLVYKATGAEDHTDPWSSFPTYSMVDVLHWLKQPQQSAPLHDRFAGKVVLIGPGTAGLNDLHLTPFNAAQNHDMLGVEVHANVVNMLLTGQYLRPVWGPTAWLLVLGFCGLVGVGCGRLVVRPGVVLIIVLEALAAVLSIGLFLGGRVLPTAPLLCAIPLAGAAVYAYRFGFVWKMFGRYVSTSLLEHTALLELGTASKRNVTVLFTDINSFSTTCERHTPDEIIGMLNRYFEAMNEIIVVSGGWIKQFVGDEIMVIYGAPDHHPRPHQAAVETALKMVAKLADMRAATQEDGFFEIKAGIHSGQVIVGNVGSRHRTEYAAVGDDVNLGSRIMGMTKGLHATILISEATYEKVSDLPDVEFVDHGPQAVKGRQEKVRVFEVKTKE